MVLLFGEKQFRFLFGFYIWAFLHGISEAGCPFGYVSVGGSNCYKLLNVTNVDWDGAWSLCLTNYGDLIKNLDYDKMCLIDSWLRTILSGNNNSDIWTNSESGEKHNSLHRELHFDIAANAWQARKAESKKRNYPLCEIDLESSGCYAGWKSFNSMCYRLLSSKPMNFEESEKDCVKNGGHLATATSKDEWGFILFLITKDRTGSAVWIGLRYAGAGSSNLEWVDGTPIDKYNPTIDSKVSESTRDRCYTLSASAIAANNNSATPSVNGDANVKLQSCAQELTYMCKVGATLVSSTLSQCKADYGKNLNDAAPLSWTYAQVCPDGWQFIKENQNCACIRFEATAVVYEDADKLCQSKFPNSRLVSIRSEAENEFIVQQLLQKNIATSWIGYTKSSSGSPVFDKLSTTPLNNDENFINAECAYVQQGGTWMFDWCYNRRSFICRLDSACDASTTSTPSTTTTMTTTPTTTIEPVTYPTVNPVEKAVAVVFQTLGSTYVVTILAATVAAFITRRNFSVERVIMMSEEMSLLGAHVLLLTAQDNYGNDKACIVVAVLLHYLFLVHFTSLFMNGVQVYAVITSVVASGGFFDRRQYLAVCWGAPALVVIVTALGKGQDYINHRMCFLNLSGEAATYVIFPIAMVIMCGLISAEAAGVGEDYYPRLSDYDHTQMTTCLITQKGLLFILPLSAAGWFCSMVAVSEMNMAFYTICVPLNITLACFIFFFHALSNPEIRFMFYMLYQKAKQFVCRHLRHKLEDGSFEVNIHHREISQWK